MVFSRVIMGCFWSRIAEPSVRPAAGAFGRTENPTMSGRLFVQRKDAEITHVIRARGADDRCLAVGPFVRGFRNPEADRLTVLSAGCTHAVRPQKVFVAGAVRRIVLREHHAAVGPRRRIGALGPFDFQFGNRRAERQSPKRQVDVFRYTGGRNRELVVLSRTVP